MSAVLEPPLRLHRFSRAEYDQMVDAGIFGPEDRIELLDGEIIDRAPQKSRHATATCLMQDALRAAFGHGYDVRPQLPLCLDDRSEPEPDIAVVTGGPRDYLDAHPATAVLVVEVAESTLSYDRGRKAAAYARNGIPEYWILNVADEALEVHRGPENGAYTERRVLRAGERIAPRSTPGHDVAVADILP